MNPYENLGDDSPDAPAPSGGQGRRTRDPMGDDQFLDRAPGFTPDPGPDADPYAHLGAADPTEAAADSSTNPLNRGTAEKFGGTSSGRDELLAAELAGGLDNYQSAGSASSLDELASIYASSNKRPGASAGPVNEDRILAAAPPPNIRSEEETRALAVRVTVVVVLLILIGMVSLLVIQRTIYQPDGTTRQVPLAAYFKETLFDMTPEERAFQKLDPEMRNYLVTDQRQELVFEFAVDSYKQTGVAPRSTEDLFDQGYLREDEQQDAWGHPFLIRASRGEVVVVSGGTDEVADTADDLVYTHDGPTYPVAFRTFLSDQRRLARQP